MIINAYYIKSALRFMYSILIFHLLLNFKILIAIIRQPKKFRFIKTL